MPIECKVLGQIRHRALLRKFSRDNSKEEESEMRKKLAGRL